MALATNNTDYYGLNGNSNDAIGGNNGTDTGITYSSGNGKIGQGAGFALVSVSHINTSIALNYTNTSAFTWGVWCNMSDNVSGYVLTSNVLPGVGNMFVSLIKDVTSGKMTFQIGKSGTGVTNCTAGTGYTTGNWEYYVMTYDGANNMELFRNGSSTATASYSNGAAGSTGSGFYMGYANNATNYITGALDEVSLWTRVLSGTEITQLYNSGNGFAYPYTGVNPNFLSLMV